MQLHSKRHIFESARGGPLFYDLEMDMFNSDLLRIVVIDCLCKPFNLLPILGVNNCL